MADNNCDVYTVPFAAWELRLYLNSHPTDTEALKLYHSLTKEDHYASVPQRYRNDNCWTWIEGPWPWEYEANAGFNFESKEG